AIGQVEAQLLSDGLRRSPASGDGRRDLFKVFLGSRGDGLQRSHTQVVQRGEVVGGGPQRNLIAFGDPPMGQGAQPVLGHLLYGGLNHRPAAALGVLARAHPRSRRGVEAAVRSVIAWPPHSVQMYKYKYTQ